MLVLRALLLLPPYLTVASTFLTSYPFRPTTGALTSGSPTSFSALRFEAASSFLRPEISLAILFSSGEGRSSPFFLSLSLCFLAFSTKSLNSFLRFSRVSTTILSLGEAGSLMLGSSLLISGALGALSLFLTAPFFFGLASATTGSATTGSASTGTSSTLGSNNPGPSAGASTSVGSA